MLHNLLPTQERLYRMSLKNAPTPNCTQCDNAEPDQLHHALLICPQNREVTDWLLQKLRIHFPTLRPQQIVLLDFGNIQESLELPILWLVSQVLGNIWKSRKENNVIIRKTRFKNCCTLLETSS